ncbi:uncharacterized protein EI97DRAFT_450694 [Westerdykella ornata]|uniref:DUF7729 domain-containing protein n=1 Tax=Westerdykella ornata TaxID=318751 RepID=A0A6A6JI37_WESOR|nr:uncharacterized protein EI97DRAFT_450694 [Westerdykella ornata]KAF2275895.1 hypothetical protein EI97DRAFT_450694 [Westerdykella ornata]
MHLHRRQNDAKVSSTASANAPKSSIATDPNATPSDFKVPTPFDTALSNNYTASCAAFFRTFLTNKDFSECHPFSLMLQTSSGFFDASKSFVRITQTLEATCRVDMTKCTDTMNHLARELIGDNNCAVDYANDNPQVIQAYNGLIAYEPLYQASCLKDDAGSYCYANAVTNRSAITDPYPYYLPLGVPLPGGTRATCNSCLQDVMAIFSSFAGNTTQPISQTYNGAAQQIGIACGTGFVNQTATPLKAAAATMTISMTPAITVVFMLLLGFFV